MSILRDNLHDIPFTTVCFSLIALHQLELEGRADSPDAETARTAADRAWYELSDDEKGILGECSESLFAITDPVDAVKGAVACALA